MDWGKIFMLLQIAELSRGYGANSPVKTIHDSAVTELSNIANQPVEVEHIEEHVEEVEETEDE